MSVCCRENLDFVRGGGVVLSKEIFEGLFIIKHCWKLNYVTMNKSGNICMKKVLPSLKNVNNQFDNNNLYCAITHKIIVDRIKKDERMKVFTINMHTKGRMKFLKKYLCGEKSACPKCIERDTCKVKRLNTFKTDNEINEYMVFFKKK